MQEEGKTTLENINTQQINSDYAIRRRNVPEEEEEGEEEG